MGRYRHDGTDQFPELECLRSLRPGTVLDGELVLFTHGLPDFEGLVGRNQIGSAIKIRSAALRAPVTYVAFNQLFSRDESLMERPLRVRRDRLQATLERFDGPRVVYSDGIEGEGLAYFEAACARQLEGITAKRLDRGICTRTWLKIKRPGWTRDWSA